MSGRHHPALRMTASGMLAAAAVGAGLLGPALAADGAPADPSRTQVVDGQPVGTESVEDLSKLLPVLLTSAERKQLAAELEASIRGGDLRAAENKLNTAIEMGTLAIVLIDRLHDPNLLRTLHAFGVRGGDHPAPSSDGRPAAAPDTMAAAPDAPNVTALQEALAREQARNGTLSQELATLRQEHRDLARRSEDEAKSLTSRLSELQEALSQEQAQKTSLSQELAALRQEHRDLAERSKSDAGSSALKVSELQDALQRAQAQNSAVTQELAALRQDHRSLTERREGDAASTEAKLVDLQDALKREQERSETSSRQLASLQDEHRTLKDLHTRNIAATKSKISELQDAWQQERQRGDDAERQLAKAEDELRNLQASSSAQQQSAAAESARSDEMKEALAQAQARADALARELAAVTEELRASRKAQEASAPSPTSPQILQVTETAAVPPVKDPKRAVASAIPPSELDLGGIAPPLGQGKTAAPAAKPGSPLTSPKPDDRLLIRADELFRRGDVSGARLLLERSMEAGHARAAFLLAETFDPHVLSRLGALGIRGDAAKARELYDRARSLGIAQAQERIEALK